MCRYRERERKREKLKQTKKYTQIDKHGSKVWGSNQMCINLKQTYSKESISFLGSTGGG